MGYVKAKRKKNRGDRAKLFRNFNSSHQKWPQKKKKINK